MGMNIERKIRVELIKKNVIILVMIQCNQDVWELFAAIAVRMNTMQSLCIQDGKMTLWQRNVVRSEHTNWDDVAQKNYRWELRHPRMVVELIIWKHGPYLRSERID